MDMAKPTIRFKGYQDDWEQRKAKELCNIGTGKSNTQDQVEDGIYPFYIRSDIPVKSNKYLYDCEAVITIGDGNIGRVFHYVNGKFDLHQRCYKMTDFQDIWGKYFYYFFSTRFYERAMKMTAKATVDSVRLEMISEMDIWKPTAIDEQKKIAEFFSNLDHLITLHQRKCDETKKLKKYMLQKMFPQNGEKVPEIRFLGFTDDWEQRKLGEVFKEYSEKNHTELPALTIIQGGGTVKREDSDRILMYDESNLSSYKMVRKDDFIVHLRSFEGGLEKSSLDGIVSPAYHTFHSDVADSRFYYPYFRSHEFIKHKLVPHVYGIRDGRSIDIDGMKTIEIPYTSMEEQRKIGGYLESLDTLITLHQRELENLQNIKRFMLGKMFV